MYKASAEGNAAKQSCSKRNGVEINAKTIGRVNRLEEVKGKIDITILNKANKTVILISC